MDDPTLPSGDDTGETFPGSSRFVVEAQIGSGAFGVVYRAYDRERRQRVALKSLQRTAPSALYRFKREFRALANVSHPNLVTLYELQATGDHWFFTMELLVDGVDFMAHARRVTARDEVAESVDSGTMRAIDPTARLRSTLRQLVDGLRALHAAGHLHRDLKPSNVIVLPDGRAVLLDFGLVTDLDEPTLERSHDVVGTPAYMSPEQSMGRPLSPASDWYSLGAMLFEALTGELPYRGSPVEVLLAKQSTDARPVTEVAPLAPPDLAALCDALLARDPAARPDGEAIQRQLAAADDARPYRPPLPAPSDRPFVGRETELAELRRAFDDTRDGRGVVVTLHGQSGMGKSALLREFLAGLEADEPVVLRGRCYEQESVPYKGLDAVIDALSRFLAAVSHDEAAMYLPRKVGALAVMFPVLEQVRAIADGMRGEEIAADPHERRRQAFAALRALLARLAALRRLIIVVDDAHWGDADSAALVRELLQGPDAPRMLFVVAYRSDEADISPLLSALLPLPGARDIELRELDPGDAARLAEALMDAGVPDAPARAREIAAEADGSPFFIDELVRYTATDGATRGVALTDALASRVARLPPTELALLRAVCVAGLPIDRTVAGSAAGVTDTQRAIARLRAGQLVRSRRATERHISLEAYHDRIREVVTASLDAEARRDIHGRLAAALADHGASDPETLAVHFEGAGDVDRASEYVADAADRAARALAWNRAARLYRRALALGSDDGEASHRVRVRLGDALANAGRGPEAVDEYRLAIGTAGDDERARLRQRIAAELLRAGLLDEGYAALDDVLSAVGLRLPPTPRRAVLGLIGLRARLRLRGLRFEPRDEAAVAPAALLRIDTCWAAGAGLAQVDTLRGAYFLSRCLLDALRAGEPYRVGRALAFEAGFQSNRGAPAKRRVDALLKETERIAQDTGHAHLLGLVAGARGVAEFHLGHWRSALSHAETAETIFRERCRGVAKEIVSAQLYRAAALVQLGELAEAGRLVREYLRIAERHGDLYGTTNFRSGIPHVVWLADDDVDGARDVARAAMQRWTRVGFNVQHFFDVLATAQTDLYAGDGAAALGRVRTAWPRLRRALLMRLQSIRILAHDIRGRAALLAASQSETERAARLKEARTHARALAGETTAWGTSNARAIEGGIAAVRGDADRADALWAEAAAGYDAADMAAHAAAAAWARGRADALDRLGALGARAPERFAAMLVPGAAATR